MYRPLKVIVPAIQVIVVLAVFVVSKLSHDELNIAAILAQGLVRKVNFPLACIWFPFLHAIDKLSPNWPSRGGTLFVVATVVVATVIISSVAVFWYFVVVEIEMRSRGKSMLRFSGLFNQFLAAAAIFLFGFGAIVYAYESWFFRLDQILGALILVTWGVLLLAMATKDLVIFFRGWPRASDRLVK